MPSLRVATLAGTNTPTTPAGSFRAPDLILNSPADVPLELEARNIPPGTRVKVTVMDETKIANTYEVVLEGTLELSTAQVDVTVPTGFSRILTQTLQ